MAASLTHATISQLVVVGDKGGVTVVDPSTPLKRLNYFDGKFLRASDFEVEQQYLRHLVALSNQGLGPGVVYGYHTTLGSGDNVEIGPGLAIDPSGNVLLLQAGLSQNIQELIDRSRVTPAGAAGPAPGHDRASGAFSDCIEIAAPPPAAVVPVSDIYVIAICAAEALCGQADVYGKLCEEACVTSTDRPYRLDGVVLRAIPLQLVTPFPTSTVVPIGASLYLRSKVAHSWYADEVRKHPDAISRAGLLSNVWCLGAGYDSHCCEVPLAVVARAGATTVFLDAWIVRRERMDAPARRDWQWKMRMRPWDVFLAQILQFQCHLADLLSGETTPGDRDHDPCGPHRIALREAADFITKVRSGLASVRDIAADATLSERPALLAVSLADVSDLHEKISRIVERGRGPAAKDRILIRRGLIELPAAGYLPVVNGGDVPVNDQVVALLGEGLDLRFCVTTADSVAHAIEERQHMERISLLQGLDDPSDKPRVDILVPDGRLATGAKPAAGLYDADLTYSAEETGGLIYRGAAREEVAGAGSTVLHMAAAGLSEMAITKLRALATAFASATAGAETRTVSPNVETNTFVTNPRTVGVRLDSLIANISSSARMFSAGAVNAATRRRVAAFDGRVVASRGSVDGMWLTAKTEREWRTLTAGEHTPVTLRLVIGSRPAAPLAFELSFNGTLSITGVASGPVLTGTLNGILAIGVLKDEDDRQTTDYLLTERFNWPATVTYAGNESSGSIALDLALGAGSGRAAARRGIHLRFLKTAAGAGGPIAYQLAAITGAGSVETIAATGAAAFTAGRLRLAPDPDIANPSHAYHQYADSGLDILQAALQATEPNFKSNAEAVLFPAPQTGKELAIEAVRDWVAFVRRREKACGVVEARPEPIPPRIYRVLNLTARTLDDARSRAEALAARLNDPAQAVPAIQQLLLSQDRANRVRLFVKFAGGKAIAQSDLAAAGSDWKTFNPGETIVYAAIGAVGESDAALQIRRLGTFEAAVSADSQETAETKEEAIVPYPQAAVPADADGIMVFVTATEAVERHALLIYSRYDRPNHFLQPDTPGGPPQPSRPMDFANDAPQGSALQQFVAALTADQPVRGVTLATTKADADEGANERLQAVLDALVADGRPMPAATRQVVERLNAHDRRQLAGAGHDADDFDEVIFFELNAGS